MLLSTLFGAIYHSKKGSFPTKPVIFSIITDKGFDKIIATSTWKERCGQTHTMVITGYDDSRNAFLVMNSWGTSRRDKGFIGSIITPFQAMLYRTDIYILIKIFVYTLLLVFFF